MAKKKKARFFEPMPPRKKVIRSRARLKKFSSLNLRIPLLKRRFRLGLQQKNGKKSGTGHQAND